MIFRAAGEFAGGLFKGGKKGDGLDEGAFPKNLQRYKAGDDGPYRFDKEFQAKLRKYESQFNGGRPIAFGEDKKVGSAASSARTISKTNVPTDEQDTQNTTFSWSSLTGNPIALVGIALLAWAVLGGKLKKLFR